MKREFTPIIEAAPKGDYWAVCPEITGANGQGGRLASVRPSPVIPGDDIERILR